MTAAPHTSPLVSVATPVYNGAEFLRECIESVLAQTYQNWEYTIVNNCSTDATLEIAREYAARDPRIRVISNDKFLRAIENYNVAVRQMSDHSRYMKIVAADDWLFPDCLAAMVALGEENPTVGLIGAYGMRELEMESVGLPFPSRCLPGREVCRARLLGGEYYFGAPTSVMYRADAIRERNPFYNASNLHADSEVCFDILKDRDFGFVHQVLTFRREHHGSLMSFSMRVNTYLAMVLIELLTYGPEYLTDSERARRIREQIGAYYWYLGKEFWRGRDRGFWSYHRDKLAQLGFEMSRTRIAAYALGVALDFACNPKSTLQKLLEKRHKRIVSRKPAASPVALVPAQANAVRKSH